MKYIRTKDKIIRVFIGGYHFTVEFVSYESLNRCDGRTCHNDRVIKIRDDLDEIATELILRHELTHAILGTQGRVYQEKFNVEEVCEFIAYRLPEIDRLVKQVLEKEE